MLRDCKKWRRCVCRAHLATEYSAQRAIWTIIAEYGNETAERLDKSTLVEMVHKLMLENGLDTRRIDADCAVEDWYGEAVI